MKAAQEKGVSNANLTQARRRAGNQSYSS
jgi:hypothetical protein